MKRIIIGDSIALSAVTMGMMRIISGGIADQELETLIGTSLAHGIDTFDHAMVYGGNHACEERFGRVLARNPAWKREMTLVSKFGIYKPHNGKPSAYYDHSPEAIRSSVEQSLAALGVDRIDVMLVHRPSPLADPAEIAQTAADLIKEGKIGALGTSNFTPAQSRALQKHMDLPLAVNQIEMSILGNSYLFDGTADYAHETGMPLMAWSPMAGGRLFQESEALTSAIQEVADAYRATPEAIAYAWLYTQPLQTAVVTGSMQWPRIEAALQGLEIKLTTPEWFYLLEAARGYRIP